uniref:Uncharacterized protein n=1 Tax=Anguilla anguilla TaxID=7936 RepID=A0A0E9WZ55_ANGAN
MIRCNSCFICSPVSSLPFFVSGLIAKKTAFAKVAANMFICVFCMSWFIHLRVRPDRLWGGKDICASLSPYKCKELQPYTMFPLGPSHPTA